MININDEYKNMGLVLEGGGMRGVFTCGVLDYFIENNIYFPYTIGVSSGACHGISYIARQYGRAKSSAIDLLKTHDYVGLKNLIFKGNFFDYELLFDTFPNILFPFDFKTYSTSNERFIVVATNGLTGKAEYIEEKHNRQMVFDMCRASCCLPVISQTFFIENTPMIDGGLVDSIPIKKAIEEGYTRSVVVLTRNAGYRKKSGSNYLPWFIYRKYPQIRKVFKERNIIYNKQLDLIEALEKEDKIVVIRPINKLQVGRLEKNISKLEALYNEGYQCAKQAFE